MKGHIPYSPDGTRHGTTSGYRNGCKCNECTTSAVQAANDRRARHREAIRWVRQLTMTRVDAPRAREAWTDAEIAMLRSPGLTITQIAEQLGRSPRAVAAKRAKARPVVRHRS